MRSTGPGTPYVAVIGPSLASADEIDLAREVGALLATRGAIVVCGGHGGVMEAVCKGATQHGGQTVGVLPGNDRTEGNAYLTIALPTGLGELRNGLVVRAADAVIAVGGSWGTMSEIALAVRGGKPVIALKGWQLQPGAASAVSAELDGPIPAESAEQAVALAFDAITHSR
jgi:uncharacterized protein (TIGR00725 family)